MTAFLATLKKELRQLVRDRAGLAILFLMPMVLVVVVSLVQENVMRSIGAASAKALLVDKDGGEVGRRIAETFRDRAKFRVEEAEEPANVTDDEIRALVGKKSYQFCLVIPEGTSAALAERAEALAAHSLGPGGGEEPQALPPPVDLVVHFEPTVQGGFRAAVLASLREALLGLETETRARALAASFRASLRREMERAMGVRLPESAAAMLPELRWREERILGVSEAEDAWQRPTSVQQNVPAWTLFGMFFIVVPLSGAIVRERKEATLLRLFVSPASFGTILLGKVAAYVLVCQAQFALMLSAGFFVLPLLGSPSLAVGSHPGAILALSVAAALAATGYGLFVGAAARTYEQASMFGAVSVVIAAALGGVMVPSYVMPPPMQAISRFSPLSWGLEGFLDLFVRGGGFADVLPNALLLLAFAAAATGAAWLSLVRHRRGGL